jgi:hypothetical protein
MESGFARDFVCDDLSMGKRFFCERIKKRLMRDGLSVG